MKMMSGKVLRVLAQGMVLGERGWRRLRMMLQRSLFGSHGRNFTFDPDGSYTYLNIHVGDDVSLGWRPTILAALSEIRIGSKVMFGPYVIIIGGSHNIVVPGRFMIDVHDKAANDDLGVVIEDDVWVGARAMILRGVRVGRGAVIGAGSVVTKSVPPYALVAGIPARVIRFRWDAETVLQHELALYSPSQRLAKEDLERWRKDEAMLPPGRRDYE